MLRELEPNDAAVFYELQTDEAFVRNIGSGRAAAKSPQQAVAEAIRSFREHGFGLLAVCESESGRMIGTAGLVQSDYGAGEDFEVICAVLKTDRRRGFGAAATRELIQWGFAVTGRSRLLAIIRSDNENGGAELAEELGFEFVEEKTDVFDVTSLVYATTQTAEANDGS